MEQNPREIFINAEGAQLVGHYFPALGSCRAALVLNGATGVPQRYYRHFAQWAATQGVSVLTYDYRDFGASQRRHPRQSKATFADWLLRDQAAAQDELAKLVPDGALWVLGHSLGGLGVPFHAYDPRVERVITVGSGFGHYTDHPWSYRPKVLAFWFLLGPIATRLAGFLPGKSLRLGADLPANVYWQWRRWCIRRDFYLSDIGQTLPSAAFSKAIPSLRMCVARDDVVVPPIAVQRYAQAMAGSGAQFIEFAPEAYGVESLSHIEILGRQNDALWRDLVGL